jgi:pyruvate dehydrogenase E1 component alpha subunit
MIQNLEQYKKLKQPDTLITVEDLIEFENSIIKEWENGKIRGPIHLSNGNEKQLIEVFKRISKKDWVFSTWRSHYHALLKGIPAKWLKKE